LPVPLCRRSKATPLPQVSQVIRAWSAWEAAQDIRGDKDSRRKNARWPRDQQGLHERRTTSGRESVGAQQDHNDRRGSIRPPCHPGDQELRSKGREGMGSGGFEPPSSAPKAERISTTLRARLSPQAGAVQNGSRRRRRKRSTTGSTTTAASASRPAAR
jgi:hypothetical protein